MSRKNGGVRFPLYFPPITIAILMCGRDRRMNDYSRKPFLRKKQKSTLEKHIEKVKQLALEFWPTEHDEDANSRYKKNKKIFF